MSKLTIFLLIIIIIGALSLLFFIIYSKLSYIFSKTTYAEKQIENELDNKHKCLIKINAQAKKTLRAKKDYLENITELTNENQTNQERDRILSDYCVTVDNLVDDYKKLSNHKEIKKQLSSLSEINEKLDAAKTYYNEHMKELSEASIKFPANIICKIVKIKIHQLYDTNESIKKINEDL